MLNITQCNMTQTGLYNTIQNTATQLDHNAHINKAQMLISIIHARHIKISSHTLQISIPLDGKQHTVGVAKVNYIIDSRHYAFSVYKHR